jgi:hypothetical protein
VLTRRTTTMMKMTRIGWNWMIRGLEYLRYFMVLDIS